MQKLRLSHFLREAANKFVISGRTRARRRKSCRRLERNESFSIAVEPFESRAMLAGTVTLKITDDTYAAETTPPAAADTATFLLERSGSPSELNTRITVDFSFSGLARDGWDYVNSGSVILEPNITQA